MKKNSFIIRSLASFLVFAASPVWAIVLPPPAASVLSDTQDEATRVASEYVENMPNGASLSLGPPRLVSNQNAPFPEMNHTVWELDLITGNPGSGTPNAAQITVECDTLWFAHNRRGGYVADDDCDVTQSQ